MDDDLLNAVSEDLTLPDIFGNESDDLYIPNKGDIVWAEFRSFHWPALIRNVYKKRKKVSVWYLDSPDKIFKLSMKKIKSFNNTEISEGIRKAFEESPQKHEHERVLFRALSYIQRRTQGIHDDPKEYFDISRFYLTRCQYLLPENKTESANEQNELSQNVNQASDFNKNPDFSSDEESLDDDTINKTISEKLNQSPNYTPSDSDENHEEIENIVSCIKNGQTNTHLLKVSRKKVPSTYRTYYEEAMASDRRKLWDVSYGPVKSLQKLVEISSYLMDFYEQNIHGKKGEMVEFVTSVWLPESIHYAMSILTKKIPGKQTRRRLSFTNFDTPSPKKVNGKVHNAKRTVAKKPLVIKAKGSKLKYSSGAKELLNTDEGTHEIADELTEKEIKDKVIENNSSKGRGLKSTENETSADDTSKKRCLRTSTKKDYTSMF